MWLSKKIIIYSTLFFSAMQTHALQSLNDDLMADVTGQDGMTVGVGISKVVMDDLILHDNSGLQPIAGNNFGITTPEAGAMVFKNLKITTQDPTKNLLTLTLDMDGGNASNTYKSMLNLGIKLEAINLETDGLYVAKSKTKANPNDVQRGYTNETRITDGLKISLGQVDMNIQLGNSSQGHMMLISGVMSGGVTVDNLGIYADGDGLGSHYLMKTSQMRVTDNNSNDLTFNSTAVDVRPQGLVITPDQTRTMQVTMNDFVLGGDTSGSAKSFGGISLSGLSLGSEIRILGHQ